MSFLIIVVLVILLIVQSNSAKTNESKAYQRGYSEGYWRARREADPEAAPQSTASTLQTASAEQPVVVDRPEKTVADKQKAKSQTLNITLYAASLLLVGGIVLFANAITDQQVILLALSWLIVATYYLVGFALYDALSQLRPVAVAFVGTALAGLPFVGTLLHTLLDIPASSAWLITSAIALAAYVYAAIRLRSQVLGYAITAIIVSCGLSLVSVLGSSILWFFVVTIGLAAVMTVLSRQLVPNSQLAYIVKPLAVVGRWLPVATIILSVVLVDQLTASDYAVVWGVAGIYYLAQAIYIQTSSDRRTENWIMARGLLSLTVLFVSYAITPSAELLVVVAASVGLIQVAISTWGLLAKQVETSLSHQVMLWFGLSLTLLAPVLLVVGVDNNQLAEQVALGTLSLTVLASLVSTWLLRRQELAYMATAALVFLPGLAVYHFIDQATSNSYAWAYIETMLLLTGWRIWREVAVGLAERLYFQISIGIIGAIAAINLLITDNMATQIGGLALIAAMYYALAWCDRRPWVAIVGNIALLGVIRAILDQMDLDTAEITGALAFVGTVLFASGHLLLRFGNTKATSLSNVCLASAVGTSALFGVFSLASEGAYASLAMLAMIIGGSLVVANRHRFNVSASSLFGAILITIATQRLFALGVADVSMLFYIYWWTLVVWLLGYLEHTAGRRQNAVAYGYTGLSLLSVFGLGYALAGDSIWYQVLFIIEHSLLLLIGLAMSWRTVTIWGAAGVTLAILWMFRDFTSLFLTLIGIIIILVVIWIIRREADKG